MATVRGSGAHANVPYDTVAMSDSAPPVTVTSEQVTGLRRNDTTPQEFLPNLSAASARRLSSVRDSAVTSPHSPVSGFHSRWQSSSN